MKKNLWFPRNRTKSFIILLSSGSPKWDRQIRKKPFVTLNCNISWFLNDRNIFFLLSKKKIRWSSAMMKISFLGIVCPQQRPPQNNNNFYSFSHFRGKLDTFLQTIFWKLIEHDSSNQKWEYEWEKWVIKTILTKFSSFDQFSYFLSLNK